MQTLTPEQYKAKYGDKGAWSSQPTSSVGRPTIAQVIGNAFNSGIEQAKSGFSQAASPSNGNPLNLVEGIGKAGSGIINAALSPLAPVTNVIGKGLDTATQPLQNNPAIQKFANSTAGKVTSRIAENVGNYANIAGAVGGAMELPKVGSAINTGASDIIDTTKSAYNSVLENVSKYPKQIADRITTGQIEPKVQTILKETPVSTFDKYVTQGEKALKDPRELTPLEVAGNQAEDVAQQLKAGLKTIGQKKAAVLDSVKQTRIPNIATEQIDKVKPLLQTKLTDAERSLVNQYIDELKTLGTKPTAKSVDGTIDKLQATLYEKSKGVAVPTTPRIQGVINKSIGEMNSKLKSSVDAALSKSGSSASYSELNNLYAERVNTFNQLNKLLGEGGTKGGSLMKRFFSPQDSGVKELFATIKNNYGVDLGKDATVAKFVMDTLGDTRARSLLQLPPKSALGIAGKALDYVESKLKSPKKVIEKARTLTKP